MLRILLGEEYEAKSWWGLPYTAGQVTIALQLQWLGFVGGTVIVFLISSMPICANLFCIEGIHLRNTLVHVIGIYVVWYEINSYRFFFCSTAVMMV